MTDQSNEELLRTLIRVSGRSTATDKMIAARDAVLARMGRCDARVVIALRTFFKWAMQEGPWQGGDLDGGSVQDKAESLGLIVPVPYDPEKHGAYNDYGCDAGDPWFEFSPALSISSAEGKSP